VIIAHSNDVSDVAVADVNGDGRPDLVTANDNNSFSVLLGYGDGRFASPLTYGLGPDTEPGSVAIGDLNGDGKPDLVFQAGLDVLTLLGRGDGTFDTPQTWTTSATGPVVLSDLNKDGKLDIVTVQAARPPGVIVMLGTGDGTFSPPTTFRTALGADAIAVADLNGDGTLDVVTANRDSNTYSVLLGNGRGGFAPATTRAVGDLPDSVTVGDFNQDGKIDAVIGNNGSGGLSFLAGKGDGTFEAPIRVAPPDPRTTGADSTYVVSTDLNGDGHLDLAFGSVEGDVSLLLGRGDGSFAPAAFLRAGRSVDSIVVADLNGDGQPDVVTSSGFDGMEGSVWILRQDGRTLQPCVVPRVVGKPFAAAKRAIDLAKCTVGEVRHARSQRDRGLIIHEYPASGTPLAAGIRVDLVVSKGLR
jgi:hypothetical protein